MENLFKTWNTNLDDPNKDKKEFYQELLSLLNQHPNNVGLCWRLVEICLLLADNCEHVDSAEQYVQEAHKYGKMAIEVDPNSLEAQKWYCASVGRLADYVGIHERLKCGQEFKDHYDIAVKIDSNDRMMHHMFGRWCYQIASLSIIERNIAETKFPLLPAASYDQALVSLMKADILCDDWRQNKLWIAKVHIALRNYDDAVKYIDAAMALPGRKRCGCRN